MQQPLSLLWTESHLHTSVAGAGLDAGVFFFFVGFYSLTASLSTQLLWRDTETRTHTKKSPTDSLQFLRALSSPLSIQKRSFLKGFFFSSFSPSSTVFCRVAELLATLHQPLGLISVRTWLPSLPLRAPTATAHASNSTLQRTYD